MLAEIKSEELKLAEKLSKILIENKLEFNSSNPKDPESILASLTTARISIEHARTSWDRNRYNYNTIFHVGYTVQKIPNTNCSILDMGGACLYSTKFNTPESHELIHKILCLVISIIALRENVKFVMMNTFSDKFDVIMGSKPRFLGKSRYDSMVTKPTRKLHFYIEPITEFIEDEQTDEIVL